MSRGARLWTVLVANLALVGALIAVGLRAHSVGVWAEGADDLGDAVAVAVALLALRVEAPSQRRPQGRPRASHVAALANAGWLLVLAVLVAVGAVDRLATGTSHVHGLPVLIVSGLAALVMLGAALVLGGDLEGENGAALSVRAVLLDTAADAATAAGVAAAGGIIFATGGLDWLDPAVALVISIAVARSSLRLLARIRVALRAPSPSETT